ncbi:helix-turn-helix transcriptional regulator [Lentibacillus sp.]|uniref:helix-turn-helix transcriptional regulator n=1 Tax=Lentibacillus sp. TaxID=1925746 RepID=UPI002B4AD616|nr:helix-turn-helix transcriptional regulator [Lentibacillus sp.]HLS07746.1 helix-turn-helix transcriptional regulator [Lentibacillus sp.]
MKVGNSLKELRGRKSLSQENMARDIFVSQQLYSGLESNKTSMSEDLVRDSVHNYNDAKYGFEIARQTARDYITPIADSGKAIEWHRLALAEFFINESAEAIEYFKGVSLVKSPEFVDDTELTQVKEGVKELLDVQLIVNSLLSCLEQEYNISIQVCMKSRMLTWRDKEWIR